jgi:hypothetical protein
VPGLRPNILDTELDIGIFAHEPKLTLMDRSSQKFTVGAFPPKKLGNTYYHILNFGIAPGIRFLRGDEVLTAGYMPLRILTFGSSDFFEIPPYPYRFLVSLEPDKTLLKGDAISSQYNLERPVYRVRVFRGDTVIKDGNSREGIIFDGYSLYFFQPSYWILLEAVKDPALQILRFSLLRYRHSPLFYTVNLYKEPEEIINEQSINQPITNYKTSSLCIIFPGCVTIFE